jgi:hypothetical protein
VAPERKLAITLNNASEESLFYLSKGRSITCPNTLEIY